jgi:hypothetical protein
MGKDGCGKRTLKAMDTKLTIKTKTLTMYPNKISSNFIIPYSSGILIVTI